MEDFNVLPENESGLSIEDGLAILSGLGLQFGKFRDKETGLWSLEGRDGESSMQILNVLAVLVKPEEVEELTLRSLQWDDQLFSCICPKLAGLKRLRLWRFQFHDIEGSMAPISELRSLKDLSFKGSKVPPELIREIRNEAIERLDLSGTTAAPHFDLNSLGQQFPNLNKTVLV